LAGAARSCTACHLYKRATQIVFGEGPKNARLMLLGEQPGDQEDFAGKPFVGPVGKLLDRALEQAGIKRHEVYVTNTVKHFKWERRGKRRIPSKPNSREIAACRTWLEAELRLVSPELVVLPWRDCGPIAFRIFLSGHARSREDFAIGPYPEGFGDGASIIIAPAKRMKSRVSASTRPL
jgi:uracil-DNA glycosylase family 4